MPQARPQSYVALALATLAVMLAAWWAWDAFTTIEPVGDESAREGTFLPPDEYPPPDDAPEAPPQAAEAEPEPAMLEAGRPPLSPPELKPPTLVAPRVRDGDTAAEAAPRSSEPTEEEPGRREDLRSPSEPSTLLGGVARPNERATPEVRAEGGSGWIGSPPNWVASLARQRSAVPYVALPMEAPRHREEFEPFFLDRFEVSNHRYWEFMRDTASVLYRTSGQPDRTIVQITEYIILDP
ncbi:MAG: hypothetical protein P1V36_16750, partial [Planctomycetota bacterium]|nr:hypothetical protein [Planctomycetota bacterium]